MSASRTIDILQANAPTLSVGILTADLMFLHDELALLSQTDVKVIHFDVMDGIFVPRMTVGPPFVKGVKTHFLKDVHLMIQDPFEKVDAFVESGADLLTVHIESSENILPVLKKMGAMKNANDPDRGLVRGIAITPESPIEALEPLLDEVEMVVVLAVDPRIKGMPFYKNMGSRCARVREMISAAQRDIFLCVDGGVKRNNISEIAKIGADIVVSGSAIYDGKAVVENARFFLDTIKSVKK
jgi:ribulose-phosphate 3-epimerase